MWTLELNSEPAVAWDSRERGMKGVLVGEGGWLEQCQPSFQT